MLPAALSQAALFQATIAVAPVWLQHRVLLCIFFKKALAKLIENGHLANILQLDIREESA